MKQVLTVPLVLLLIGGTASSATALDEDRTRQLEKERQKLENETDPIDRAKIGVKISDLLLDGVGDAARDGDFDLMEQELDEYAAVIQDAHNDLIESGRNAVKRPNGFKELEIALRKHVRKFEDLARTLNLEQRIGLEKTKDLAGTIRDKLLKALFP